MNFDKIGVRDFNVEEVQSHQIKLKQAYCPTCGSGPLDGVTGAVISEGSDNTFDTPDAPIRHSGCKDSQTYPKDGSPTLCAYCGELLVYRKTNEEFNISLPTNEEIKGFKSNPELWGILSQLQEAMRQKKFEKELRGEKSPKNPKKPHKRF
jgi:hypothetical protein